MMESLHSLSISRLAPLLARGEVSPTEVTDDRAREIARELRKRIETELQYPSTIKITVIRESRFTETAT